MKRNLISLLFIWLSIVCGATQNDSIVIPKVQSWVLSQDGVQIDSVRVDTAFYRVNNYNPVYIKYPHALYLSNKGSAYRSNSLVDQGYTSDFLFVSNLELYFGTPSTIRFFNTTTPYTKLSYAYGAPKRRSEESVAILHTQNVTKNWNVGLYYNLSSSIGRYDASLANYRNFQFFSSYQGDRYSLQTAVIYNKSFNYENGGLVNDSSEANIVSSAVKPESIPVYFRNAETKIENYRFFAIQSLGIGSLNFASKDSLTELPPATAYYTFDVNSYRRTYTHGNDESKSKFYKNFYTDSLNTNDSTRYLALNNLFQIKFNEEANSLLKFGLRAYIGNTVEMIKSSAPPIITVVDKIKSIDYQQYDTTLISSYFGGQIFKNNGNNFWWNGGAKLYFQGYKAGEMVINGTANSQFPLLGELAGLFANGALELKVPNYFQNHYYSNNFKWDNNFRKQKFVRANAGVRMPTRDFELAGHINYINDYVYWDENALPTQYGGFLQTYGVSLYKHAQLWIFHSINNALVQYSSNQNIMPLPLFSIYSSNYLEVTYAKVLHIQFGADIHYNTKFYAPAYMPSTGVFTSQSQRSVGNYPFITPFLNMHLKRANIFIQYEHVNQGWPNTDYYLTINHAYNPRGLKFGVSWLFYD